MPQVNLRRRKGFVLVSGVLLVALAGTHSVAPTHHGTTVAARACPPGFVTAAQAASDSARERRAQVNGLRAKGGPESDAPLGGCSARNKPERASELMAAQADSS